MKSGIRHSKAVPVVIIAGFLGSGKTTLLNHLLRSAQGTRIGVLVNDFGSINVDAMLVAGQVDGTVQLGNGCLCCTVDSDGLVSALEKLVRPAAGIDVVVIEASGIAEPRALVRMITTVSDDRIAYGGLVYVVDAATCAATRADHPELDRHAAIADLVVVNKVDLAGPADAGRVDEWVREINSGAAVVATSEARVDPALLFDVTARQPDVGPRQLALDELLAEYGPGEHGAGEPHGHRHLHDDYTSVDFCVVDAMDPRRLARFLERPPQGCYRIKGVVHLGGVAAHRYVIHGVGGFVRVERGPWGRGESRSSTVVVIGTGLDADEVRSALLGAVWNPDAVDPNGILHITRYLPDAGASSITSP